MCFSLQHQIVIFPFVLNCFYLEFDSLLLKRRILFLQTEYRDQVFFLAHIQICKFKIFHTQAGLHSCVYLPYRIIFKNRKRGGES